MEIERLGKYEINAILGKGAMGVVYAGWDPAISRKVAIKTVKLPDASDLEAQEEYARFKREAQAAGRLHHPNIVGVFDYGETDTIAYIVMEFVDGRTLKAVMDAAERMSVATVVGVMQDLLAGLRFSHERGVIHRDIKPANLILTAEGQAKIADFGIARIESSNMTQAGTIMGTPAYMSPEQFMGQTVDLRTDIYSSGVLLFQMLTGDRPFEGSMATIMHKVLNTAPPRPSELSVTAPVNLDAVVATAMARRPDDRYSSAAAFSDALQAAMAAPAGRPGPRPPTLDDDGTVIAAAPKKAQPGPGQHVAPPAKPAEAKRGSLVPVIAVAAVVVLALAGGGAWWAFNGPGTTTRVAETGPAGPTAPPPTVQPPPATPTGTLPPTPPQPQPPQPQPTRPVQTLPPLRADTSPVVPVSPPPPERTPATPVVVAEGPPVTQVVPPSPPPVVATVTPVVPLATPPRPPPSEPPTPTARPATADPPPIVVVPPQPEPPRPVVVQPVPTQPTAPTQQAAVGLTPDALRQAVGRVVQGTGCAAISGDVSRLGEVQLRGVIAGSGQPDAALQREVRDIAPTATVDWGLAVANGPYCGILNLVRPFTRTFGGPAGGVALAVQGDAAPLVTDDYVISRVTMPEFSGYLQHDYFSGDGSVLHMVSSLPGTPMPANSAQRFGDPKGAFKGWQVFEPYGTDLVVTIASSAPLFPRGKALPEQGDAYIPQLEAAIAAAQRQGIRLSAAVLVVRTRPKP